MPRPWKLGWGGVIQGHRSGHVSIRHLYFLLTFHNNHGPISYRFRDKRKFQSKIANFSHPRVFCAPTEGVLPLELVPALAVKKLEWWASGPIRKYDDIFNRLDTMHQCDRRTDRRADIGWQQRPRWRIASRGNKTSHNLMYSDF